jgi:tRNA G18 (ribose-2'-O)-methylase SpoU
VGFTVLALTPAPDAVPGPSRAAMAASDMRVVIPMHRGVDSLNVAAAAAVAFYELCRDGHPSGG